MKTETRTKRSILMQIKERRVGDVVILDLKGKITLGEGDEQLKDMVNDLLAEGNRKIVLNTAEVPYIDSSGLAEITRSWSKYKRQGGALKFLNLTKRILDLLDITRLHEAFQDDIFVSEDEAVASFAPQTVK